ncbi:MAG: alanine racemase [Clostridiales bacterium]|nr:alanine racemase [Clostridiales bacterium]
MERTYVKIDLDAIRSNVLLAREKMKKTNTRVMAIIKADAYGHGAVEVARALEDIVFGFGVAIPEEGVQLRRNGIKNPILILGNLTPDKIGDVLEFGLTPSVSRLSAAKALSDAAAKRNAVVGIHIGVDTGMGRIGFLDGEKEKILEIAAMKNLVIEGLCTHYARADERDKTASDVQKKCFDGFDKFLKSHGIEPRFKHISNSAGIIEFDGIHYDVARAGIMIYGLYPSKEVAQDFGLIPAMSWYARISHIKTLPAGRGVSYGAAYVTKKPTRIATIPVGYADGYPRALSGKGRVIINGRFAPIAGRVCMDQFMVDVTDVPNVDVGTPAVLVGRADAEFFNAGISNAESATSAALSKDSNADFLAGISNSEGATPTALSERSDANFLAGISNAESKTAVESGNLSDEKQCARGNENTYSESANPLTTSNSKAAFASEHISNEKKCVPENEIAISVEELADAASSFNYEFVCGIGMRVPKYYYKNGKFLKRINYIESIVF